MIDVDIIPSPFVIATQFRMLGVDIRSFREPLNRSVRQVAVPSIRTNFAVGGRPQWEPLAEATIDNKAYYGFSDSILIRTGKLAKGAAQINNWHVGSEEAFMNKIPATVLYGLVHQDGSATIPARPFLMLQEKDIEDIQEIFADWLDERIARRFGI